MFVLLTADWRKVGVNLTPSMKIAAGANKMKDMIVIIENSVMLSKDSCKTKQCYSSFIDSQNLSSFIMQQKLK